jgi:cbb3-type cytochrome oxidase subunit 3
MTAIRVILTIAFGWSALKGVEVLCRGTSMDLHLFTAVGMPWLLYVLLLPAVLCYAGGVVWVWRPYRKGLFIALVALTLNLSETAIATLISLNHTDLVKEAHIASREARGLPVRQEVLAMMDSPASYLLLLAMSLAFVALWVFLLVKVDKHYRKSNLSQATSLAQPTAT